MNSLPVPPAGSVAAILPAAGQSRRFSKAGEKKVFARLGGCPVWQHAVERLRRSAAVGPIIIAIADEDQAQWDLERETLQRLGVRLCAGGQERSDSVREGLRLAAESPMVAIHDAARPLVPDADIAAVIAAAWKSGAALLATPVRGTLKRQTPESAGCVTVDREHLWEALTPQVFRTDVLRSAYDRWQGRPVTDDAQLVERNGVPVEIVPGSAVNLKITQPEDLQVAAALLAAAAV